MAYAERIDERTPYEVSANPEQHRRDLAIHDHGRMFELELGWDGADEQEHDGGIGVEHFHEPWNDEFGEHAPLW